MEFVPMEKELAIMESSINGSPYRLPTSSTTRSLDLPSFIKYNSPRWLLHEAIGPSTQEVFQRNSSTPTSLVSDDIKVIWIWILHKIRILCLSWTLQTLIEVLYSRWRILKRLRDFFPLITWSGMISLLVDRPGAGKDAFITSWPIMHPFIVLSTRRFRYRHVLCRARHLPTPSTTTADRKSVV